MIIDFVSLIQDGYYPPSIDHTIIQLLSIEQGNLSVLLQQEFCQLNVDLRDFFA